jgi:hypothetical protein
MDSVRKVEYDGTTSDLNISSGNIDNCSSVLETLLKAGVTCSVVEQKSVICKKKKCWLENGCRITLTGISPNKINERVWQPLQSKFHLDCAHLHVHGKFRGCIFDFIGPSKCPGTTYLL